MPTTITGSTGVSKVQDGVITVEDLNGGGSGSAPVFGCRAWVNFDGTKDSTGAASTANTARLIRASGNVTSVVRNSTGDYTVNFTTAMPDRNYSINATANFLGGVSWVAAPKAGTTPTTSAFTLFCASNNAVGDFSEVNVAIFR
jgi:hypothetical protein